ncbi:MAG: hypothetical protein WAN48_05760 [Actinomycetes bacterium]
MGVRIYRLTVEGELSDSMARAFPGMILTRRDGFTTLTGEIVDQAGLQAVMRRLSDLGLTLLESKAVEGPPMQPPAASSPTSASG